MTTGTAVFSHVRFDSIADFAKVIFNINASFIAAQFLGESYFPGARFKGSADFSRARFLDLAVFGAGPPANSIARFEGPVLFEGTQFDSIAWYDGVSFNGPTSFVGSRFGDVAHFETSMFRGPVSFRSTTFHAVYFSKKSAGEEAQFGNVVDLLGCVYDRIEIDWRSLLRYPNGQSRISPFNRQPYIELEDVLRKAGFEKDADEVFTERRRVEYRKGSGMIWDRLYWLIANYDIDLWHEFVASSGFLLCGIWLFSRPNAVVNDERKTTISWWRALCLSVRQFLPFSLPAKPRWLPEVLDCLHATRNQELKGDVTIAGADPVNLIGILIPGERTHAVPGRVSVIKSSMLEQPFSSISRETKRPRYRENLQLETRAPATLFDA